MFDFGSGHSSVTRVTSPSVPICYCVYTCSHLRCEAVNQIQWYFFSTAFNLTVQLHQIVPRSKERNAVTLKYFSTVVIFWPYM